MLNSLLLPVISLDLRRALVHAMYTLRSITEHCNLACSTADMCALDLSKAFDKISHHHGLLIQESRAVAGNPPRDARI